MKKIIIAIPFSHTWFWPQTCLSSLLRYPAKAEGCEVQTIVIDNSWNWSPAIRGIRETKLGENVTIWNNTKSNRFHASALDDIVDNFDFDFLMAWETDVLALNHGWLQWFMDMIEDGGRFAVGHWHHEQFVNPSCTIYRGSVLREMNAWCKANTSDEQRWGDTFEKTMRLNPGDIHWINGPFSDKRGFEQGHTCVHRPTGQNKGFGWYEPGQMLFHWASDRGYPYMVCNTAHTETGGCPAQTIYGQNQQGATADALELNQLWERGYTAHVWGGTRALDIIKHDVSDQFVRNKTPWWLQREARFWLEAVDADTRNKTVELIHQHGWHEKDINGQPVQDRDRNAAFFVNEIYRAAGIPL